MPDSSIWPCIFFEGQSLFCFLKILQTTAFCALSALVAALLSHGRGAAFHAQPSTGTMKAFQRLVIEITAYNNMWGEYHDDLICVVGGVCSSDQHIYRVGLAPEFLFVNLSGS